MRRRNVHICASLVAGVSAAAAGGVGAGGVAAGGVAAFAAAGVAALAAAAAGGSAAFAAAGVAALAAAAAGGVAALAAALEVGLSGRGGIAPSDKLHGLSSAHTVPKWLQACKLKQWLRVHATPLAHPKKQILMPE